jgi:hypothetical protein
VTGIQALIDPDPLLNGFVVDMGRRGTRTLLYGDVPANVRAQSVASQETWINDWFAGQLDGMYGKVHIYSLDPFRWTFIVSQDPIPAGWPYPPLV